MIPFLLDKYPRYFICGPMVFMPASQELVAGLVTNSWVASMLTAGQSPLVTREMGQPAFAGEEIITLGYGLLPHKTAKGYTLAPFSVLSRLNGTPVRNLAHLVELVRERQR